MIQFNLLPDVKLEYIKTQRTKYLLSFVSIVLSGVALAVLLFSLFVVQIAQKRSLSDLQKDISTNSKKLQSIPDLNKILTVQNQLVSLPDLHKNKPVTSRLFGFLAQLTPQEVSLDHITLDYAANSMEVGGSTASLSMVNAYVDTYKSASYTVGTDAKKTKAFSDVVMSTYGKSDRATTFTIHMTFDPVLFKSNDSAVNLVVPVGTHTSESNLFQSGT